jgi:predicted PurR-regulated permease PerM
MPRKLQQDPGPSTAQPSTPNPAVPRKRTRTQDPPPSQPPVQEVRIQQPKPNLLLFLYQGVSTIYEPLLMVSFVPFLVYFMLAWRDHMRRAFVGLFAGETKDVAMRTWHAVADMARAYVAGNFMLGLVLAIFSTLFFMLIRLPYPLLLGPISGFLSLVPYVGLPLAVAPPLLAALPVYDQPGAYFIIATTVGFLHLIGLNLLYPKMVGGRVHLNPLAVTVALMFWGLLWGGAGLVLAIPITAGLKAVFDNVTHLKPYGRLLGD